MSEPNVRARYVQILTAIGALMALLEGLSAAQEHHWSSALFGLTGALLLAALTARPAVMFGPANSPGDILLAPSADPSAKVARALGIAAMISAAVGGIAWLCAF